ncbi:MAG TPA: hypothetical protein VMF08_18170 [Candidatus Sulfotelmatobacter sp.]|nr:hypothetical protein [Candidatus Sulfotelmatobacter sp.]
MKKPLAGLLIFAGCAIALLLFIGTTATVVNVLLPAPDIQGTWEGRMSLPGYGLHRRESPKTTLIVRIIRVNGLYQATMDNIGLGSQDVPFDTFTYKYPYVEGEISTSTNDDFSFVAKVSHSGNKMTWKAWENNLNLAPTVFSRTTHPTPFPEPLTDSEFAPRADSPLQGFWVGRIGFRKKALHIQLKIAEASDGTYRAEFYDPDQCTNRFPATVSYDGGTVKVTLMANYGMFEGWLRDGGKQLVGNWVQYGGRTATTLTNADYSEYEAREYEAQSAK